MAEGERRLGRRGRGSRGGGGARACAPLAAARRMELAIATRGGRPCRRCCVHLSAQGGRWHLIRASAEDAEAGKSPARLSRACASRERRDARAEKLRVRRTLWPGRFRAEGKKNSTSSIFSQALSSLSFSLSLSLPPSLLVPEIDHFSLFFVYIDIIKTRRSEGGGGGNLTGRIFEKETK